MQKNIEKSRYSSKKDKRKGAAHHQNIPEVGLNAQFQDEDGIEMDIYAEKYQMTVDAVWNLLRSGKLLGRMAHGRVLIFEEQQSLSRFENDGQQPAPFEFKDLPPLPSQNAVSQQVQVLSHSQEVALLIDHLSIAKEENREILKLTQEALSRMSDMNGQVVAVKNELLATKDDKIKDLADILSSQEREIQRLRREKEDLETVVKNLHPNFAH